MILSLNEIESTAKKAARGAGYPWGLAEEAGKATRWLCAQALDGCALLAGLLDTIEDSDLNQCAPRTLKDRWDAAGGSLCPISTGAALSDRAELLRTAEIRIGHIQQPGLLIPFAANCAQRLDEAVTLVWSNVVAVTDGARLSVSGAPGPFADGLSVRLGGDLIAEAALRSRAEPDAAAWDTLNRFACRTYAPSTEESRLKGAGAGLSDND